MLCSKFYFTFYCQKPVKKGKQLFWRQQVSSHGFVAPCQSLPKWQDWIPFHNQAQSYRYIGYLKPISRIQNQYRYIVQNQYQYRYIESLFFEININIDIQSTSISISISISIIRNAKYRFNIDTISKYWWIFDNLFNNEFDSNQYRTSLVSQHNYCV